MALPIEPAHASRRASAVGSMLLLVGSAACLSAPSKVPQASDAASAAAISASLAGRYDNMAQVKRGKTSGQTPPPQHVIITIEPTPQDDWQIWRIHMDVDPEVAQLAGSDTSLDACVLGGHFAPSNIVADAPADEMCVAATMGLGGKRAFLPTSVEREGNWLHVALMYFGKPWRVDAERAS